MDALEKVKLEIEAIEVCLESFVGKGDRDSMDVLVANSSENISRWIRMYYGYDKNALQQMLYECKKEKNLLLQASGKPSNMF